MATNHEPATSAGTFAEPPENYWDSLYDELRRIAHSLMGGQNWTRQPTELVNDAYLREQRTAPFRFKDRTHFRAAMARRLRQVYLDEWSSPPPPGAPRANPEGEKPLSAPC